MSIKVLNDNIHDVSDYITIYILVFYGFTWNTQIDGECTK